MADGNDKAAVVQLAAQDRLVVLIAYVLLLGLMGTVAWKTFSNSERLARVETVLQERKG